MLYSPKFQRKDALLTCQAAENNWLSADKGVGVDGLLDEALVLAVRESHRSSVSTGQRTVLWVGEERVANSVQRAVR